MIEFVCFISAVVLSIVLGNKTKINIGIWSISFAFILGMLFLGKTATAVFSSYFPTSIFSTLFVSTAFFGIISANGTMGVMTRKFRRMARGKGWLVPFAVFFAMLVLGVTGGGDGARVPMGALAASLCYELGINPFVGVFASWAAFTGTMNLPWAPPGAVNFGVLSELFGEAFANSALIYSAVLGTVFLGAMFVVVYFVFGSHKAAKTVETVDEDDGPTTFNATQKTTLKVLYGTLFLVVVPSIIQLISPNPVTRFMSRYMGIVFCFMIAILVMFLLKVADSKTIMTKGVSWDLIVLIIGVSMLFSEAVDLGVIDIMSDFILSMPSLLVIPALSFVSALLSMFVTGLVLTPFFASIAVPLAAAANCSVELIICVVLVGMAVSCCSPASSGGATAMSGVSESVGKGRLVANMAKMAVVNMIVFPIFMGLAQFVLP